MKDCFEEFLRRIPRFQDLASRLKPRKVNDPFVGKDGCLRSECWAIWYGQHRLFTIKLENVFVLEARKSNTEIRTENPERDRAFRSNEQVFRNFPFNMAFD